MVSGLDTGKENGDVYSRFRNLKRFLKILLRRKVIVFAIIVLLAVIILAIFAPFIAPHDANYQDLSHSLENPSKQFPLGTDKFGRDLLSRIIFGSRISLMISFVTVGIGGIVGLLIGMISGYFGGWLDMIIMRIIDAFLAIPMLIIALSVAVVLGPGLLNVIIALSISIVPGFARLVRSMVLSIKQHDYVIANRLMGASNKRIMFIHILPNIMPPLLVHITIHMGLVILAEASLSFLGIGLTSNEISWGTMISLGYPYLLRHPLLSIAPGFMVILLALSWNLAGDGLRDAMDPKLRGTM